MKATYEIRILFDIRTASPEVCNAYNKHIGTLEVLDSDGDRVLWASTLDEAKEEINEYVEGMIGSQTFDTHLDVTDSDNETMDEWAARMLRVIHRVCGYEVVGGSCGLGSQDGVYVDANEAMRVLQEFERVGYEVGPLNLLPDLTLIVRDHQCSTRGLLVSYDDEFPGERNLSWYDESKV